MKKDQTKKISVIIPCYNCSLFVGETLQSLEEQTYKDFEVICVNDGSTDDTLVILENIKKNNSLNLIIINQINSGVSVARNHGIEAAKGKYVVFLDSDDIFNKNFSNYMIGTIETKDVNCVWF